MASDGCLVPVTPHFLSVEGLKNLLHTFGQIEREVAALPPIWGIALTMVDSRYPSTRRNVADLRARYGDLVFQAEIPFNIHLAEAPASGKPIFEYAARSGATRSYWTLSKELVRRIHQMQHPEPEYPSTWY
jgi:chromosome partitioning protein